MKYEPSPLELKWKAVQWHRELPLPPVGLYMDFSGPHGDKSCDQDRAFSFGRLLALSLGSDFAVFQVRDCWPVVYKLAQCWFRPADILKWEKKNAEPCLICRKPVLGYLPEMCCSGRDCGCMGVPTNPCICSDQCATALLNVGGPAIRGDYETRRIRHGIAIYQPCEPPSS